MMAYDALIPDLCHGGSGENVLPALEDAADVNRGQVAAANAHV